MTWEDSIGRKGQDTLDNIFRFARFKADRERYQLWCGTCPIKIERIPLDLLFLLLENSGNLVHRKQIVAELWGDDVFLDSERSINTAVRKVRKALGDDLRHPQFIETVVGKGYRFIAPLIPENQVQNQRCEAQPCAAPAYADIDRGGSNILLRDLLVEAASGTAVLTCNVVINDVPLGRLKVLELQLPFGVTLPLKPQDRLLLGLHGVRVALTSNATQALQAFSISVLQRGLRTRITDAFHLSEESVESNTRTLDRRAD